jgi:serine-type D-Ala-D-Ala carboxypeptidase (penicillin-binding protein 5/6)
LNQNDSITLPNTITFQDAVSAISYDNTAPGQAAVITYTYNDVVLGRQRVCLERF